MNKTRWVWLVALLVAMFLLAMPVGAQETTGQASQTVATGQQANPAPDNTAQVFGLVMDLIEKAAIIVALILMYRSVPADKLGTLFDSLTKAAEKTQNPYDDLAVRVAKAVSDALQKAQAEQPTPKPGETVIRSTTTSIIADPAPEIVSANSAG